MTDIQFPGIYFDLLEDDYHAVPALSNSGIKNMLVSPSTFWHRSWMNPDYEDKTSPSRAVGKAYHKMILEGDEVFDAAYAVKPTKDNHPDAFDGAKELKAWLKDHDLSATGTIAEMCDRIRAVDADIELFPVLMSEFNEANEGKEFIDQTLWNQIQQSRYILDNTPSLKEAFSNGYSEVSIFWMEYGIPMKARFDYLKHRKDQTTGRDAASLVDLKTFANQMDKEIREAVVWEITNRKYFCQPVAYTTGFRAIKDAYAHGDLHVDGDVDLDWLERVLTSDLERFFYVFCQTGDIPNIAGKSFDEWETYGGNGATHNAYWTRGQAEYSRGLELFLQYRKQYGPDVPWLTDYGVTPLKDEDLPPYALETRHVA